MDCRLILMAALGWLPTAWGGEFTLAVVVREEELAQSPVTEAMSRELAALLRPAGIDVNFQPEAPVNFVGRADAVVVVEFRSGSRSPLGAARLGSLGWISRVDGEFQPLVVIDAQMTASYVAKVYHPHERALNVQGLGMALARVLMHELIHYFTGSAEHGVSPLFSETVSPYVLIAPGVGLEPEEVCAVREGMVQLAGGG